MSDVARSLLLPKGAVHFLDFRFFIRRENKRVILGADQYSNFVHFLLLKIVFQPVALLSVLREAREHQLSSATTSSNKEETIQSSRGEVGRKPTVTNYGPLSHGHVHLL